VLAAVDFHALGQVILISSAAGISVSVLYSVAVFSFDKANEARRGGQDTAAIAYGAIAVLALVVFGVSVVVGVVVMLKKD